jgi:hypothetical protein
MPRDDIKEGQRVSHNNVHGTVVRKRRVRDRHVLLVKMDNGFTLKFDPHTLSASPEAERRDRHTFPSPKHASAAGLQA